MIKLTKYLIITILFFFSLGSVFGEASQLSVGADIDYAPFSYYHEGKAKGFDVSFFNLLSERIGTRTTFVLDKWHEVLEAAEQGKFDIVLGAIYSQNREEYLNFSVPYNTMQLTLVVHEAADHMRSGDLRSKEMAALRNDAVSRIYLESNDISVVPVYYDTLTEALEHLNDGEHDFAIIPEPYIDRYIDQRQFKNLRVVNDNLSTLTYRIGVTDKNVHLLPQIDTHIKLLLKSEQYERLRETYLFTENSRKKDPNSLLKYAIIGFILVSGVFIVHILLRKNYTTNL